MAFGLRPGRGLTPMLLAIHKEQYFSVFSKGGPLTGRRFVEQVLKAWGYSETDSDLSLKHGRLLYKCIAH